MSNRPGVPLRRGRQQIRLLAGAGARALRMRRAVWGTVAYATVMPIMQVALLAGSSDGGAHRALWALAATACFLPLYCRHVFYAAQGHRPPRGRWTLAAMAVVIVAALPLAGPSWLPMFHALVVSAVIVAPLDFSIPISVVIIALQAPLAVGLHSTEPEPASYYVLTVAWRSAAAFVPIWLVGAITQLEALRARLAHDAVVSERLTIDSELRTTVGAALETIADRGDRAMAMHRDDPQALRNALRQLVDAARAASFEVRQLVNRYHRPSLRAELDTAVTLLAAAGVGIHLATPADLPDESDAMFRAELRALITRALRDDSRGPFVMSVRRDGDGLHVQLRRPDSALLPPAVGR